MTQQVTDTKGTGKTEQVICEVGINIAPEIYLPWDSMLKFVFIFWDNDLLCIQSYLAMADLRWSNAALLSAKNK